MICKDCGKFVSAKDGKIIDGEFICNECLDEDYFKCDICGEYHKKDDMYYIEDTKETICAECYVNGEYFFCSDCGHFYSDYKLVILSDTQELICEDCAEDNYFQCDDCGGWFKSVAVADSDTAICDECWQSGEWWVCNDCGSIIRIEDGYRGDDEKFYCKNCIDYHLGTIKAYHSFDDWDYRYESDEQHTTNIYYGFEIEVAGDRDYAEKTNELLDGKAVLMEDESVSGFEIVTDPMTKKYYYNSFMPILENTMEFLKQNSFRGHNAGGIHIHVSENACNNWEGIRTLLNYNNIDLLLKLTQREELELQCYARLYSEQFNGKDTRYQALNHDNRTGTYEFRIFNSNLRIERITKNFEIVLSLIDFTNNNIITNYTDIKKYIKFVKDNKNKYQNLYDFMIEKEVIKENILTKASNKIAEVLQLCA